ncbi:20589_t:CDS:2 [Cetraspora pellucida]|uniref:20589_t:CDS:1 n=1 Tax=Cetraspora pellucida TaxID=1433469 RepID=A0A9N9HWI4_9GLOM|nr:20589_t:CDS:2 [Cetraspora pellucida]
MALRFPKGDFYIKSATSPSGTSTPDSCQNLVVDVERGFFMIWSAIEDGSKVSVAPQRSNLEHDAYQLWHYEEGWLINKQTNLCLEAENKAGQQLLSLYHRKSSNQANNQRWFLTKEGRIALQNRPKCVLEVKESSKHIVLVNLLKNFKDTSASQFIMLPTLFYSGNNEDIIAQTKFIQNDMNPVWNEVHYLPVRDLGEKFMLEMMNYNTFIKDKPLGSCHLEVTHELVREVSEDVYEGTSGIDVWIKLTRRGQIHYKAKFFPVEPFPKPSLDFLANLKEKPFDRSTFYVLITLQASDGSFPLSDKLANLFGYESQKQLLELYICQCKKDHILKNDPTLWTTSMILWFLRFMLKDYRSEWGCVYERAEQYISKSINDLDMEEIVVATGRKAVRKRFML